MVSPENAAFSTFADLRVEPSGARTFVWYYKDGPKTKVLTLGRYGDGEGCISLKAARDKLEVAKERHRDGERPERPANSPNTVGALAEIFYQRRIVPHRRDDPRRHRQRGDRQEAETGRNGQGDAVADASRGRGAAEGYRVTSRGDEHFMEDHQAGQKGLGYCIEQVPLRWAMDVEPAA